MLRYVIAGSRQSSLTTRRGKTWFGKKNPGPSTSVHKLVLLTYSEPTSYLGGYSTNTYTQYILTLSEIDNLVSLQIIELKIVNVYRVSR